MGIVAVTVTFVPSIFSTLIDPSARLATSAMVPVGLNDRPEGCLPSSSVSTRFGGFAFKSITNSLFVGPALLTPFSCVTVMESATNAIAPFGEIARFVGGPTIEFSSGRDATILGSSGLARSTIRTASLPVGLTTGLPAAS